MSSDPTSVELTLTERDAAMLAGDLGPALAMAMRVVVAMARLSGATELLDVTGAHIDACLFHGYAGLDFAELLARRGGRVAIPTTLNVSSLDLLHPERYNGKPESAAAARRLMDAYVAMGAEPTWTCAPYQLPIRPGLGEDIAWAESNAIVFANSVLGARTGRYGDFIDIASALTGRVPRAGLHLTENRRARVVIDVSALPVALLAEDAAYPLLGYVLGHRVGADIPVLTGFGRRLSEDQLKAMGAAAASSGSVAMFHVVGSTPEAPTLQAALQGSASGRVESITGADLLAARAALSVSATDKPLAGVNVGTPHFSVSEFGQLVDLLRGRKVDVGIEFYANTSRSVLADISARGWLELLEASGVQLVTDTCTYITPVLRKLDGLMLTNSGKWAYYAPGNLGVSVAFASLGECVESAVAGHLVPDIGLWQSLSGRLAAAVPGRAATVPASTAAPAGSTGQLRAAPVLLAGTAEGEALVLTAPLSFWGGVDPETGAVIDVHHPQAGVNVAGRILFMPSGRGSSSSSSVLAECIRLGTAPAAIVMGLRDEILVLGAIAAAEVYGTVCPMVEMPSLYASPERLPRNGCRLRLLESGVLQAG